MEDPILVEKEEEKERKKNIRGTKYSCKLSIAGKKTGTKYSTVRKKAGTTYSPKY